MIRDIELRDIEARSEQIKHRRTSNKRTAQPARASTAAPAPPQPHTALYHCAQSRGAPPRYAARGSLQQDPVADDDDATTDATRQFDLPHAQHNTRTRPPTRTTHHTNERGTTTRLAPRAPRPRAHGWSLAPPEAKHVTRSETRHQKRNTIESTNASEPKPRTTRAREGPDDWPVHQPPHHMRDTGWMSKPIKPSSTHCTRTTFVRNMARARAKPTSSGTRSCTIGCSMQEYVWFDAYTSRC